MGIEQIGFPNSAHTSLYYKVAAGAFPLILVATARACRLQWPATSAAAAYMAISLVMIWVLQLFPATPKLAPVFNPVTHMVAPPFPLLLVVPRSEEHTSELQSLAYLVCRLLLEKKKNRHHIIVHTINTFAIESFYRILQHKL